MNHVLKADPILQRDVWISMLLFFCVYIFSPFLFLPLVTKLIPSWQDTFSFHILVVSSFLVPLAFLSYRNGKIKLTELIPRGADFLVLFIASLVLFVYLGFCRMGILESSRELSNLHGYQRWLSVLIVVLVSPFMEEAFFRKYILGILRNKYSLVTAILMTVSLETLIHVGYGVRSLIQIYFLGLFITLVYLKSRLGVSVIVHCAWNFLITYMTWPSLWQAPQGIHIF